ncbi:putative mediator of RNA polymerase II transcription subunit 26 [Drosophila sulfurigaster albostrigata]|uniref:putative mediator of RNA polymerase II transcription subunit 26 n=1 Tax=Drosophila sulfurigaster albostrigata TaxID=89887 RepID=UPI002D21C292|nr:putative mediator of RNA polymerase II transcription subunit 26 [Drosophila sulfurigaster albostrigata]
MQSTGNETTQLLQWIRKSVSSPRWHGLQDLANGVVWCRLMAKVLPGSIASVLIIHRPANERDSMHNYMLLQGAFRKLNIAWYFDTHKLIDGNQTELLKLGQSMLRLRDACNNQLREQQQQQQQQQRSIQRASLSPQRLSRFPAGEYEMPQQLSGLHESIAAPVESEQQQQPSIVAEQQQQQPQQQPTQQAQLKQQIETLYHKQQLAMAASLAAPATDIDPFAAVARPAAIALCLCSKCISNRQQLDNSISN